ncbi:mitochondrial succinate-fumarate transporter [Nadsonia fulvescens var. elongata DSM 6958]|uniref:Mitochondrial succinate-fumarate transporter n=1 Tax=Nadsonia fulvescens var. elongata DSM 6958 TaxID=857566 RepID=A0A1E3PSV6_9ASCO|nr:mitochondrial succinate-fumarate transporter [Nadsonia fulvescens var. elongata DSM 6958]
MASTDQTPKKNVAVDLIAGGFAGLMEALSCHPLDTIKVRMQLQGKARDPSVRAAGFIKTGIEIARKESPLSLYKGLGAVVTGIVPKMAIRFTTYEYYKKLLTPIDSKIATWGVFLAGVGAGTTEAVLVVNPMEVVKIRLQAQRHSLSDPLSQPKYRNAGHCTYTILKEEGFRTLYRGVVLTAARQATNQGVNFTVYSELKSRLQEMQPDYGATLPSWQTSIIGLISGALGPLSNAPIDTIKTRMQRELGGTESGAARFLRIARNLVKEEGARALYKGITPRICRVAPGQAVTFTVYEYARKILDKAPLIGSQAATFEE